MTNKDRKNKVIQRQGTGGQKTEWQIDKVIQKQSNRWTEDSKKAQFGILYWENGANKPYKSKKAFKAYRVFKANRAY